MQMGTDKLDNKPSVNVVVDKSGWVLPETPPKQYQLTEEEWQDLKAILCVAMQKEDTTFTQEDVEKTKCCCWLEHNTPIRRLLVG
jgi:hypothetical protein